jgi:hypothetical protein
VTEDNEVEEIETCEVEAINSKKATIDATKNDNWSNLIMLKIKDSCISNKAFDWLLNNNYLHESVTKYEFF